MSKNRDLIRSCDRNFQFIDNLLAPDNFKCNDLKVNCQKLREGVADVGSWVREYDFEDTEANGYWSFLRLVDNFCRIVIDDINKHKQKDYDPKLISVSKMFLKTLDIVHTLRQSHDIDPIDTNSNVVQTKPSLSSPSSKITINVFNQFLEMKQEQATLLAHYPYFWLCKSMKNVSVAFTLLTAIFVNFPWSLRAIWDKDFKAQLLVEVQSSATTEYPWAVVNMTEIYAYKTLYVNYRNRKNPIDTKTLRAPRQFTYVLPEDGGKVVRNTGQYPTKTGSTVRCRLLRDGSRPNKNNRLIIHCHGGGLVAQSPDSHEIYLRDWASKLNGIPILSIDYSLSAKYPLAFQEVLDVYLWLTSGDASVVKKLGFKPEKIVICGDSAGGSLALATCLILNDIKHLILSTTNIEPTFILPTGYVGLFSGFRSTLTTPSKIINSMIDPFISVGSSLASLGMLVGAKAGNETNNVSLISIMEGQILNYPLIKWATNFLAIILKDINHFVSLFRGLGAKPWYRSDKLVVEATFNKIERVTKSPYLTPVNYENLNALKDLPIFLVTTHYDPCLDDNITLAKTWKGPVSLEVLDHLPHGFLYFGAFSKEADKGSVSCVKMIRAAVGLHN